MILLQKICSKSFWSPCEEELKAFGVGGLEWIWEGRGGGGVCSSLKGLFLLGRGGAISTPLYVIAAFGQFWFICYSFPMHFLLRLRRLMDIMKILHHMEIDDEHLQTCMLSNTSSTATLQKNYFWGNDSCAVVSFL